MIPSTSTNGIQSGEVTHHHDQLATSPIFASLSTKNTMKTKVDNEIPDDVDLLFAIVLLFLIIE